MASEGKVQLDNNLEGLNYQQFTVLFVIERLLQNENVEDFKIGNAIDDFGALDDVVFEVKLKNGRIITYAVQAKHSKKEITVGYFRDKPDTCAFKYFKSFLGIKKLMPLEQIGQLILWTTMEINRKVKKDWFVKYEPQISVDGDLLGHCEKPDEIIKERHRFKNKDDDKGNYPEFAKCFLDRLHPCMDLVEKFVNVLLKKYVWKSDGAAKDCQNVMVNEIIDCEGDRPTFRQAFIDGDENELQPKTIEFRKCFESVISKKFSEKKYGQFSMAKLNYGYEKYIELKVDEQFGSQPDPDAEWPNWKIVADESDLQEFFKRFLFYVRLPQTNQLKGIVMKSDVDGFDQYSGLIMMFSNQKMINKEQINQISTLIRLRRTMDVGPYRDLKFGCMEGLHSKVQSFLDSKESQLEIKTTKNVACTVSKLISVVETCLVPESKRYLVFSTANFDSKIQELLPLLGNDKLLECALKCLIVSFVDSEQIEGIIAKLSSKKIKTILVGNGLEKGFEDKLNIALLDEACKNKIRNTFISLSASQKATADTIFSADLFQTDNLDLILGLHRLYRSKSTLKIRSNELKRCDIFKSRRLIYRYGRSGDCVASFAVISDQAGTGKTEEMVNLALKERQEWNGHLVLYLDCIDIVKKFTGDIQDTICKMITPNDDMKSALIKELFKLGKVSLFMDNYDEVSESFNAKLQKLLKEIARENIHKLYIATRPHCEAQIIDIFPQSIVYSLEPFSVIDQLDYVKTLWGWHSDKDESMRNQIENNAKDLINRYHPISTLLKTPLYIHMIATINRDGDSEKFLSLGSIFEKFIDYKFEQFKHRNFDKANHFQDIVSGLMHDFLPNHGFLAFKMFTDASEAEVRDICQNLQMYGIVHLEPSPAFIHQTFQEYFLVRYFLTTPCRAIADHYWPKFVRRILGTQQTDTVLEFLDFHVDPGRSYPDLIRHICDFLYDHCSESKRAELVQRSKVSNRRKLLGVLLKSLARKTVQ